MDKRSKKLVKFLLSYAKWGRRIYPFLVENGYVPIETQNREKKSLNALHDTETLIMASLVCLAFYEEVEFFTVRSLAKAMDDSSPEALKAMEMKIRRRLDAIERYDILKFYKTHHEGTDRPCILIEPTESLFKFFKKEF